MNTMEQNNNEGIFSNPTEFKNKMSQVFVKVSYKCFRNKSQNKIACINKITQYNLASLDLLATARESISCPSPPFPPSPAPPPSSPPYISHSTSTLMFSMNLVDSFRFVTLSSIFVWNGVFCADSIFVTGS